MKPSDILTLVQFRHTVLLMRVFTQYFLTNSNVTPVMSFIICLRENGLHITFVQLVHHYSHHRHANKRASTMNNEICHCGYASYGADRINGRNWFFCLTIIPYPPRPSS